MVLGLLLANSRKRSYSQPSPTGIASARRDPSYSLRSKTIHRIDDDIVIGQHLGLADLDLHSENRKSTHSIRYSKSLHALRPVKLSNSIQWFEVIDLLKDLIFEFIPLSDLSNRVAKSCVQFKMMVTNFVGSRNAQWWYNQWLWTYFSNPYDTIFYTKSLFAYDVYHEFVIGTARPYTPSSPSSSPASLSSSPCSSPFGSPSSSPFSPLSSPVYRPRVVNGRLKRKSKSLLDFLKREEGMETQDDDSPMVCPDRVLIGFVDQQTENSCKYKSFHAFKIPFENIVEMYESKLKRNEYNECDVDVELVKHPFQFEVLPSNEPNSLASIAKQLFSVKGILGDLAKSIKYSASGRGGVANGEFMKEINRQLSNTFEQEGDYRKTRVQPQPAPIFLHFREQLLTHLKSMIYGWWPLCYSGQLVVKRSMFERRTVSKGTDITLPLFSTNTVKIVSIVYEQQEKDPITLCSFVYEKEMQN